MSLLDDASIVITPNGVKVSTLYAVIPVPTEGAEEVTNGDFATDGTPSTNTWTLGWYSNTANVSISGGKITLTNSASESSSLAYATNGVSSNNVLTTNQLYKLQYQVIANNGVTSFKYYSSAGSFIDAPIDLGVTHTIYIKNTSNQLFLFQNATTNSNISLDNVSVKEYTSADMDFTRATTATRIDENGNIVEVGDGVPRIDYTGGGCPHILAEPMRTNLVTYSEDFSNALWGKQVGGIGSTPIVTSDYATSPDGTLNADRIQLSLNGGTSSADQSYINYSITSGTESTGSIYVKTADGSSKTIYLRTSTAGGLATKTITSDWTRIEQTESVGDFFVFGLRGGFGTSDSTDLLVWGGQYERGSYATSYIPTSGGTVTRNQDIFTRDGIGSLINSTEGCVFGEGNFAESSISGYMYFASLSDGTLSNRLEVRQDTNNLKFLWRVGTYQSSITTSGIDVGVNFKFAVNYSSANIKFYVNGNPIGTINTPTLWTADTLNRLGLDDGGGGYPFYGKVKQLQVYDTSLSDTQLAALTS